MKTKFYALICVFVSFIVFVNVMSVSNAKRYEESLNTAVYHTFDNEMPEGILNDEYGVSEYFEIVENIKVSLDYVYEKKYFIKYSWANYDMSSFGIRLYVEDIMGENLPADAKLDAEISYSKEKKSVSPFYIKANDFPEDEALGYKQSVEIYFNPLRGKADKIDITLYYDEFVFVLKDVNIVI